MRVTPDFPANVAYFQFNSYDSRATIRAIVARLSYECRFVLFSRQIVARFSHVVSRLSRDRRAKLARHSYECREHFALLIRQNFAATGSRHSHERRATVARQSRDSPAKYFGEKIRIKFLNMFKTFATSSRLVRDT